MDNASLSNHNKHFLDSLTHIIQQLVPLTQKLQELTNLLLEHYEPSSLNTRTTGVDGNASVRTHSQESLYEKESGSLNDRDDDKDSESYPDSDDTEEGYDDTHDDKDSEEDEDDKDNENNKDSENDENDDDDDNDSDDNDKNDRIRDRESRYVYRCYAIPRFIVEEEQLLLKQYNLGTLQDLFYKVYEDFYTIAIFMKYCNSSAVIEDINEEDFIQMIGC